MNRPNIYLIGYMCSGKTTLARALGAYTGRCVIDLDELVEQQAGMSVAEMFEKHGEEAFREAESRALRSTADISDAIVACGGGTPCRPGNIEWMNANGITVLLEADRDRLLTRLAEGASRRPLIAHMSPGEIESYIDNAIESRRSHYERARYRFDSSLLENESEIAGTAKLFISKFMSDD